MGFVDWKAPPKENCGHRTPSSEGGKAFGVGTTWRCDLCGAAFEFTGLDYGDQRDPGPWDKWKRRADLDGPDQRPQAVNPTRKKPTTYYGPYDR